MKHLKLFENLSSIANNKKYNSPGIFYIENNDDLSVVDVNTDFYLNANGNLGIFPINYYGATENLSSYFTSSACGGRNLVKETFSDGHGEVAMDGMLENIGGGAFEDCTSLSQVSFPNCSYINYFAFQCCTSLTTADFPNCSYIGSSAFYECQSLTSISFPNCSYINFAAFTECISLSQLYINEYSSVCSLPYSNAFEGTPFASGIGSIYVPSSLVSSYKSATNWVYFSSCITAYQG